MRGRISLHISCAQAGVQRETPVGLCVDRSLEMIIGMLGILKAHGAYVPLSPTLPAERLAYMLADSGASIVLAPERLHGSLPFAAARLLGFECTSAAPATRARPISERIDSSSLAYIIYTSGSTGRPKGVEVEHGSVANLLITVPPLLGAVAGDVWTVYHSYAFDFSVWEIWAPLTSGATLVIVPDDVAKSPNAFAELLRREQVTVLNQTPSALVQLMASMDTGALNHLPVRVLICGGDAFPVGQLPQLREWNVDLWNFYGPTEATVWSTIHRVDLSNATATALVPLGKPIPNTRVHVLDGQLQPVAAGTQGELCIGGACVARGYRNRPDLTAERFTTFEGERLYRTGDLACVEHDGRSASWVARIIRSRSAAFGSSSVRSKRSLSATRMSAKQSYAFAKDRHKPSSLQHSL